MKNMCLQLKFRSVLLVSAMSLAWKLVPWIGVFLVTAFSGMPGVT